MYLCTQQVLFEEARGFLLSYFWLIAHRSDLRVAHDHGLIPEHITWETWVNFAGICLRSYNLGTLQNVNARYRRGELRLTRVNWIYRLCSNVPKDTSIVRAYQFGYSTYTSFVESNLTSLTVATIYVVLVLTAMQVGLGTKRLKEDDAFNSASYGFTVFSIMAPLVAIAAILLLTGYQAVTNWRHAWNKRQKKVWQNTATRAFEH